MVGVWVWVLGYLGLGTQISGPPPRPQISGVGDHITCISPILGNSSKIYKTSTFLAKAGPQRKTNRNQHIKYLGTPNPDTQISGGGTQTPDIWGAPPPNPDPNHDRIYIECVIPAIVIAESVCPYHWVCPTHPSGPPHCLRTPSTIYRSPISA